MKESVKSCGIFCVARCYYPLLPGVWRSWARPPQYPEACRCLASDICQALVLGLGIVPPQVVDVLVQALPPPLFGLRACAKASSAGPGLAACALFWGGYEAWLCQSVVAGLPARAGA